MNGALNNMPPITTIFDASNRRSANTEGRSNLIGKLSFDEHSSNADDVRACKFCRPNPFSKRMIAPLLTIPVSHIVPLGATPQMRRMYAGRIVASMTNANPARNLPVVNLEGKPMGIEHFSVNPKCTITGSGFPGSPYPTSSKLGPVRRDWAGFVDLGEKSFDGGLGKRIDRVIRFGKGFGRFIHTLNMFGFSGRCSLTAGNGHASKVELTKQPVNKKELA